MEQRHKINMVPGGAPERIHCSQYDVGRQLVFDLIYGNVGYTVPAGATVEINGKKGDNKGFSYICGLSGSAVTIDLPAQMTAYPGPVDCELVVHYKGATIGSANFVLDVEEAALPDGTDMSASEYASITQAVGQAVEARDAAAAAANTADQRATAASDSATNAANSETNAGNSATSAAQDRQAAEDAKAAAQTAQREAEAARDTATDQATTATEQAQEATRQAQTATEQAEAAAADREAADQAKADAEAARNEAERHAQESDSTSKIPKVEGATAGNLPTLDANGNLVDSGKKPGDFAPSGFGYGEEIQKIEVTTEAQLEPALDEMLAGLPDKSAKQVLICVYPEITGVSFLAVLYKYTANYAVLDCLNTYERARESGFVKIKYKGAWEPLEWRNPPMVAGVEYRTTERYNNKAVYTKLIVYSQSASVGSTSTTTTLKIPHGVSDYVQMLPATVLTGSHFIPSVSNVGGTSLTSYDKTNLTITVDHDSWGGPRTWIIQMKYTKE